MDRDQTSETEEEPPKVALEAAQIWYRLTSDEQSGLQYIMEPLGHSPGYKSMLLRSDVIGVLKNRSKDVARAIEAKEQQRMMFIAAMGRWKPVKAPEFHESGTPLPPDLWRRILNQLIADMKPDSMRGISTAARDICTARMVCKELYAIGEPAFKQLSLRCPHLQEEDLGNRFLVEPRAPYLWEIRALAGQLVIPSLWNPVWADKAILTRKIFEQLRILQPTGIPAAVLLAVRKERVELNWYLHGQSRFGPGT